MSATSSESGWCNSGHRGSAVYGQQQRTGFGAQRKPRKRRAEAEVRALTQEELLAEAAETELINTASLARLIAVEEEARPPLRLAVQGAAHSSRASMMIHGSMMLSLAPSTGASSSLIAWRRVRPAMLSAGTC